MAGSSLVTTTYEFEWDEAKALANERKHGIGFEVAMSVFLDPLARTLFDEEHSEDEERWVTIGEARNGDAVVVVHTFTPTGTDTALIRIISARAPTRREIQTFREG